jgi:hypothetical protein
LLWLAVGTWVCIGCGVEPSGGSPAAGLGADPTGKSVLSCSAAPPTLAEASTLIVLDWDGGTSPLDSQSTFSPLEPSDLPILEPVAPGEPSDEFKEAVRLRIEMILCGLDPVDMRVILGKAADYPGATRVYLTGDLPPNGGIQIGQADYDPCNAHPDDVVVVWGGRLMEAVGDELPRESWVNILANTCTHEIGHTLGFFHADDLGLAIDPSYKDREIMLSSHSVAALTLEQEFLVPQSTCPGDSADGVGYAIVGSPIAEQSISGSAKERPPDRTVIYCDHGLGAGTPEPSDAGTPED